MSLSSNELIRNISNATSKDESHSKLAEVVGTNASGVLLKFFGDTEASTKPYKRLSSYSPSVGDVVVVQNINNSYIITGKVV